MLLQNPIKASIELRGNYISNINIVLLDFEMKAIVIFCKFLFFLLM